MYLSDRYIEQRLLLALGSMKRVRKVIGQCADDPRLMLAHDHVEMLHRRLARLHRAFNSGRKARSA